MAGGSVHLTEGTFTLATKLTFVGNLKLTGRGNATILTPVNSLDDDVIYAVNKSNITIADFQINGNKANQASGNGINIEGSGSNISDVSILRVYIHDVEDIAVRSVRVTRFWLLLSHLKDSGDRHLAMSGTQLHIEGNTFDTNGANNSILFNATVAGQMQYVWFVRNTILTSTGQAILFDGTVSFSDILVLHNMIKTTTASGIYVNAGNLGGGETITRVFICNNIIISNGAAGPADTDAILIGEGTGYTVNGNTIIDSYSDGISTVSATRSTFNNNNIYQAGARSAGQGILLRLGEGNTVVGNTVEESEQDGIRLSGCNHCVVEGNVTKNNNQAAGAFSGVTLRQDATGPTESLNNLVNGNTSYDDQGAKTQTYGIAEYNASNNNVIRGNDVRGNLTAGILKAGVATVVRNNPGFATSGDLITIEKTIDHADLTDDGGASGRIDFDDTIPALSVIKAVKLDFTEAWNSDNTTTLTVMIGVVGDLDGFSDTADPGDNAFNHTTDLGWGEHECQDAVVIAAATPRVTFTEDDDITHIIGGAGAQGGVTITITYMKC